MSSDDEDPVVLSDYAQSALQEFYREQEELKAKDVLLGDKVMPQEDWVSPTFVLD